MWRDRDRYPEHNLVPDTFWLVIAVLLFAACGLVWLIGQVAAICFGPHHQHLPVRMVDMLGVLLRLPGTWDDPAQAWPPSSQLLLPGPVGMYAAAILTFWIPALLYGLLVRLVSPRARRRRRERGAKWASWWQLRRLLVLGPRPGGSSSGVATASATGFSAASTWPWSSATRSWPSAPEPDAADHPGRRLGRPAVPGRGLLRRTLVLLVLLILIGLLDALTGEQDRERRLPVFVVNSRRTPAIAAHIRAAQTAGKPAVLHRLVPVPRDRRPGACRGWRGPGSCDEYPFASTAEGGPGKASIAGVPLREQRRQGGDLAGFYRRHRLGNGDAFVVVVQ